MSYAILTVLHNGRCEDDGTIDGKPARYDTEQEARDEVTDIIETWKAENPDECESLAYTEGDFLIVKSEDVAKHL